MQADGFLSRQERHPFALGAAIGLNLVAVAAVLLAKGEAIPLPPKVIQLIPIAPEPDPPPPERVDPPKARSATLPQKAAEDAPIDVLKPIIATDGGTPIVVASRDPLPTGDFEPYEPPARADPMPVLTDAAPDPRFASLFQPPYPPQLERLDIEGKVVVKVLIGTDGRVRDVETVYADDDGFAAVTERQARAKWRFKPATRDGVPVETWKQLTVRFQIRRG